MVTQNALKEKVYWKKMSATMEEVIQVLYDIFGVPISQEFVERTSMIARKRKRSEKSTGWPKMKKMTMFITLEKSPEGRGGE